MALLFLFANNAASTLAANITNTATSCQLATGTGTLFPNPVSGSQQFALTFTDAATGLINEIVYVTARTGDVLTIVRAQEGTAAVSWLAGDNADNLITAGSLAAFTQPPTGRTKLTANTNFYVLATGNDANSGLANTTSGAWLTIQHGISTLLTGYDVGGFQATINVGAGTFAGYNVYGQLAGQAGLPLIVSGAGSGSTTINSTITVAYSAYHLAQNATIGSAFSSAVVATELGRVTTGASLILSGAAGGGSILQSQLCGLIQIGSNLTISGGAPYAVNAQTNGVIFSNAVTVTLTGTPAFSSAFANAQNNGTLIVGSLSFSGSATGVRYLANENGVINTNGGGANFFPGNSAGSVSNGGVYV